jgi:hypothetical protein
MRDVLRMRADTAKQTENRLDKEGRLNQFALGEMSQIGRRSAGLRFRPER